MVFLLILSFISLSFSECVRLSFSKPNPCYKVGQFTFVEGTLKLFLIRSQKGLCPQVIAQESFCLESDLADKVKRLEVYVGDKVWRVEKLR